MPSFNQAIIMGHLTRDPEIKYSNSGMAICKFGLAANHKFKDNEEVLFIDITAFGKTGELASEYLSKGRACMVVGRLKLDEWEGRDGERRSKIGLIAEKVQFLGGKGDGGSNGSGAAPKAARTVEDDDSDIPFISCEIEDGLSISERRKFMA